MKFFIATLLLASLLMHKGWQSRVEGQEKSVPEKTTSFLSANDLIQYQVDAAKWDPDVAKLAATNESDGGEDAILCLGSSSFRLWNSIVEDMSPHQMVRRAYGGAKYCDLAIHAPQLVAGLRYRAAMIFVGNDITGKEKDKTPEEVARLAKIVMDTVRKERPDTPVFLIAVTPSPSRFKHWPKIRVANESLQKLAASQPKTFFVATQSQYLTESGEPRPELFVKDMLHQNKDGYAIWARILKDSLARNLP